MSKDLQKDISVAQTIKEMAETFEELATMKMQKIRNSVLTNRDFMLRLSEIFTDVRNSYKNEIEELIRTKKLTNYKGNFSTLNKTKEKAHVLVTTNEHLVGDIVHKVLKSFLENINKEKGDLIIIGKMGKSFIENIYGKNKKFYYFKLPEIGSNIKSIESIVRLLINYKDITIYHGKFLNLVNQVDIKNKLLEDIKKTTAKQEESKEKKYLFEPSLEEVLNFFEIQIFASLFKQSLDEANLANLGSRIRSMEQVTHNTENKIKKLKVLQNKLNKQIENKKQIQRLAGITLWN